MRVSNPARQTLQACLSGPLPTNSRVLPPTRAFFLSRSRVAPSCMQVIKSRAGSGKGGSEAGEAGEGERNRRMLWGGRGLEESKAKTESDRD